jgi:hypothetical protein
MIGFEYFATVDFGSAVAEACTKGASFVADGLQTCRLGLQTVSNSTRTLFARAYEAFRPAKSACPTDEIPEVVLLKVRTLNDEFADEPKVTWVAQQPARRLATADGKKEALQTLFADLFEKRGPTFDASPAGVTRRAPPYIPNFALNDVEPEGDVPNDFQPAEPPVRRLATTDGKREALATLRTELATRAIPESTLAPYPTRVAQPMSDSIPDFTALGEDWDQTYVSFISGDDYDPPHFDDPQQYDYQVLTPDEEADANRLFNEFRSHGLSQDAACPGEPAPDDDCDSLDSWNSDNVSFADADSDVVGDDVTETPWLPFRKTGALPSIEEEPEPDDAHVDMPTRRKWVRPEREKIEAYMAKLAAIHEGEQASSIPKLRAAEEGPRSDLFDKAKRAAEAFDKAVAELQKVRGGAVEWSGPEMLI